MPTTYYPYDNGTVGPTGPEGPQGPAGPAGATGVVQSVNGQSVEDVVLDAADVGALPSNANAQLDAQYLWLNTAAGTYRAFGWKTAGVDRWLMQVDDVAETGAAAGSNFRLSARNDDGSFNKTAVYVRRDTGQSAFLTTTTHGSAVLTAGGSLGLRDIGADPATSSGGVFLYAKSGVMYVKQADGTSFQISQISYPVSSVNGETGHVTLGAADVGALPTASGGQVNGNIKISGDAGTYRGLDLATNGIARWSIQEDATAEGPGTDDGSNFRIIARDDAGNFKSTAYYVNRDTGQMTFGDGSPVGGAKATTAGPHGIRNIAWEPDADPNGFQLYAVDGNPMIKKGDGTVFEVGSGGSGGGGAVDSVNGQTGIVDLDAADVGAYPATGGELAGKLSQTGDGTNNLVEWKTPSDTIATRIGPNGNFVSEGAFYAKSGMQLGSTNYDMGGGSGGLIGMDNAAVVPTTNPTGGAILYVEGGVLKVRQSDGTVVTVANIPTIPVTSVNGDTGAVVIDTASIGAIPTSQKAAASGVASLDSGTKVPIAQLPDPSVPSGFTPESMGLKAWAGDPAFTAAGFSYPGVAKGRMTAVYINRSMSVSKIAWHIFGYAGGLLSGSWAGIYNTSGTLMRATGDLSTASYEPAEQHGTGGAVSTSNLTSAVTLSPGVYYIIWRMNYTASPVDGPALMRFDSSSTCAAVYGVSNIRRFGSFNSSATSAPSTLVPSWETDPLRFWAALA
ncbi:minor tail protein [Streptomyces phage Pablito]|uniref:Minor tail protein n=1 Tax=Streptomyces phage Pablito TaxID=2894593 RepID=A0AAE9C7D3_9CAUD|nr:minor tail protein [Streptomyces phage Pablito]UFD97960.1 hypothetical protein [Streptomyces phage Pablito]